MHGRTYTPRFGLHDRSSMGRPRSNHKKRSCTYRVTKTQLRFMRHDPACKEIVEYTEAQYGPSDTSGIPWAHKQGDREFL